MNKLARFSMMATLSVVLLAVASVGLLTGMPWVSAQAETEPTAIPLGTRVQHIDPYPWGLMYRHAAEEENLPGVVEIIIYTDSGVTVTKSLKDQITDAGGSNVSEDTWRVPTSALAAVVQRADVVGVFMAPGATGTAHIPAYDRMYGSLQSVVESYRANVPANQAALKAFIAKSGKVGVIIDAASASQERLIRTWLTGQGITPIDEVSGADTSDPLVAGMIPVGKVVTLSNRYPTARLYAESYTDQNVSMTRSTWQSSFQTYETDLVTFFTNGTVHPWASDSESTGSSEDGATGQNGDTPKTWNDGLVKRLTEHGVKAWQDDGHTALNIKVGIIDWGFTGLNNTPGLTDLSIWDATDNPNGNAYCQPVLRSTWRRGRVISMLSSECEPDRPGLNTETNDIDHGVNIAELIKDIAPSAELFYAQANSPRQVYKAARWLDETKNVDVIVHAAGWAYDGKGDGTSPVGSASDWTFNENPETDGTDEHSFYRYEPSPLKTVDVFTEDGPIWINAAGNMELITMRKTGLSVIGGDSTYQDFLVLDGSTTGSTFEQATDRSCQRVPWEQFGVYVHNLRWADSWTSPKVDLDFFMSTRTVHPQHQALLARAYADTTRDEQLSDDFPVRRTVHIAEGGGDNDACLRIRVNRDDEGNLPTLPVWLQFQIITNNYNNAPNWSAGNATTGHSIVNPASSASPNLLAMGARDIRSSSIKPMPYSSQGPVYRKNASLTSEAPGPIKPDVMAASGVATWTKFNNECDEDDTAADCGEDLYFGGTSAATGQTGGMAALVVQLFKEIGIPYDAADVASYLKDAGVQIKAGLADPNYEWGHGFIKLPCRPIPVRVIPHTSESTRWNTEDCKSTRRSGAYVDYYTFHSTVAASVKIDVESSVDSYLYLTRTRIQRRHCELGRG